MNGTLKNETRMLIAFLAGLILTSLGAFLMYWVQGWYILLAIPGIFLMGWGITKRRVIVSALTGVAFCLVGMIPYLGSALFWVA